MIRWSALVVLALVIPARAPAQDSTTPSPAPNRMVSLSLMDALQQARANSPAYRQALNDAAPAKWGVRNAYGSLLPSVVASTDFGYTGSGQSNFGGGFTRPTSAFLTSGYSLGLQWQLSGRSLQAPAQQRALQRATDEDIGAAAVGLTAEISTQYLTSLQAAAQVAVARQQVRRNEDFLALAQARHRVGQTTLLDVRQAQVTKATSDVALLRAVQAENEAKLDLLRRMGVEPPVAVEQIVLSDSFPVTPPAFQLDSLLSLSDRQNPLLRSLRAREHAAGLDVRAAKTDYLPSLSLRAGGADLPSSSRMRTCCWERRCPAPRDRRPNASTTMQFGPRSSLGGQTADCFSAFGLTTAGTALQDPVAQQIRSRE